MKLKLDLHPFFSDGRRIEDALQSIIDEAVEKRASEVEIIPGKGSGQLKKSVLRFLDRPDVKHKYHRVEKDGDNWGRLFVHFRHERPVEKSSTATTDVRVSVACACCQAALTVDVAADDTAFAAVVALRNCPSCGSPNRVTVTGDRRGRLNATAELAYE